MIPNLCLQHLSWASGPYFKSIPVICLTPSKEFWSQSDLIFLNTQNYWGPDWNSWAEVTWKTPVDRKVTGPYIHPSDPLSMCLLQCSLCQALVQVLESGSNNFCLQVTQSQCKEHSSPQYDSSRWTRPTARGLQLAQPFPLLLGLEPESPSVLSFLWVLGATTPHWPKARQLLSTPLRYPSSLDWSWLLI